jgi:bifunctional DNA-binding transcriptional regulator/antitoxin component of YhaV-PrlF toxin-antitoxin module
MAYKQKRKIVRLGATSRAITLPKGWLDFYELDQGDPIVLIGDSILIVCHPRDEEKARSMIASMEVRK